MIKEYLKQIVDNGNNEDMHKLGNILVNTINRLKDYDEHYYNELCNEMYVLAYGECITKEYATELVNSMKPYGEKWTMEQTTQVARNNGISLEDISEETWYYTMNMMYNDYANVLGSDTNTYIKMAKAFLYDVDSPNGDKKVYRYIMAMR